MEVVVLPSAMPLRDCSPSIRMLTSTYRYPWLFGSDDRMKACMSELSVPLTKEPGFHQFDVRGDIQGLLLAHPIAPVISLHHLEVIYPLFPNRTRVEALAHLMDAVNVSPLNIFQQSICYDPETNWSFSVSWGYMIYVYKGLIAPNVLEVPTLTFLSWHKRRESYAFPLNTRPRDRDICHEPSSYYMHHVNNTKKGSSTRISYSRGDRLIRRRGMDADLVVKGEEGALSLTTKSKLANAIIKGRPLNYCTSFRPGDPECILVCDGMSRESFSLEVIASNYGFEPTQTPRTDRSVAKIGELGVATLRAERGPAYDRIVLNAAMANHLLGCEGASDPQTAIEREKYAIDSERALQHLRAYLDKSSKVT